MEEELPGRARIACHPQELTNRWLSLAAGRHQVAPLGVVRVGTYHSSSLLCFYRGGNEKWGERRKPSLRERLGPSVTSNEPDSG